MKTKVKLNVLIPLAVLFCILYIFLALKPLGTELHFIPSWTEDITRTKPMKEGDSLIPYRLGQNLGYFTEDGRIISTIAFPCKSTVTDTYYATFGLDNASTTVYTANGVPAGTISAYGFPFFDEDRIYMMLPGGCSFARYDAAGTKLWDYESYAPITAFSSSKGGTAAGFADGSIVSFKDDGTIIQQYEPGGSDYPVILGVAISQDGTHIASVSGQHRQRFVIAEKSGNQSKIVFHKFLDKEQKKQLLVQFNKKDDTVYFDNDGSLGIVDTRSYAFSSVPIPGFIVQIEESSVDSLTFILSRKGKTYTISVLEPFDHIAGSFSFIADNAYIQVRGDALFVGKNNKISRITVARK